MSNQQNNENLTKKIPENINAISLKIKIEESDINEEIYFLDNTNGAYYEGGKGNVNHNHDNLNEINENNTTLIINGQTVPFKKYFIPTKIDTYSIKLSFKNKLSNCAYMFCNCKNIIDIDFSKFNTENKNENYFDEKQFFIELFGALLGSLLGEFFFEGFFGILIGLLFGLLIGFSSFKKTGNIINMQSMFNGCVGLKSLDLKFFNTSNVTNMESMFYNCTSLSTINLSSFNTQKVTNMCYMFGNCTSLATINLSNFNTENVTNMCYMFGKCSSLTTINLSNFNTENVTNMAYMFGGDLFGGCSSLITLDLSSFNTENVKTMKSMFEDCSSLKNLNLSSFKADKADTKDMFCGDLKLISCCSSDINILNAFNNKKSKKKLKGFM